MTVQETTQKILESFKRYYNVTLNAQPPFFAEAEFKLHSEQYVLFKSARLAEINSGEIVFFFTFDDESINIEKIREIAELAWEKGLSRVLPNFSHRNTDIALIIVTKKIDERTKKEVRKVNKYKSYCFGLKGWSRFKLTVVDVSTNECSTNKFGINIKS